MYQLISLPLEVLGVRLAMLKEFSPDRADRVTRSNVQTARNMRSFYSGIIVIVSCGLSEAKHWQRALVIGGILAMLAFFAWSGNQKSFVLILILWPASSLLILSTYTLVFAVFKIVSHFFPTRVLGIVGVLTASTGLLIETFQFGEALGAIDIGASEGLLDSEGLPDLANLALVMFYGAMLLCFVGLFWTILNENANAEDVTDSETRTESD